MATPQHTVKMNSLYLFLSPLYFDYSTHKEKKKKFDAKEKKINVWIREASGLCHFQEGIRELFGN